MLAFKALGGNPAISHSEKKPLSRYLSGQRPPVDPEQGSQQNQYNPPRSYAYST